MIRGIKGFLVWAFYLDRAHDHWMARGMQWLGIAVLFLWAARVLFRFFAAGDAGNLALGLVVLALWIPLWRALFGLVSGRGRW